jgi:hypothetical protein
MMAVSKFSGLECRMAEVEEQLRAHADNDQARSRKFVQPGGLSADLAGH